MVENLPAGRTGLLSSISVAFSVARTLVLESEAALEPLMMEARLKFDMVCGSEDQFYIVRVQIAPSNLNTDNGEDEVTMNSYVVRRQGIARLGMSSLPQG
jgi:hypothetical protein